MEKRRERKTNEEKKREGGIMEGGWERKGEREGGDGKRVRK